MKILYLHGLDGSLSEEKEAILNGYGEVIAPSIDYRGNPRIIATLYAAFATQDIDVIMGSSMGGFTGYYLSLLLDKPCLAFNPALRFRSVEQGVPGVPHTRHHYLQLVIGRLDDVVFANDTFHFLEQHLPEEANVDMHLLNTLTHRIPLPVFEREVAFFLKRLREK
jgi:uncharacterized protein